MDIKEATDIKRYSIKPGITREIDIIPIEIPLHHECFSLPHQTDFYQIFWIQEGCLSLMVDFNELQLTPDSLLFLGKEKVRQFNSTSNCSGKILLFTENFFCKKDSDIDFLQKLTLFDYNLLRPSLITITPKENILITLFNIIERELNIPSDLFQYDILRNCLHNLLLHAERNVLRHNYRNIKKDSNSIYALQFRDMVETSYKHLKLVQEYAIKMNISKEKLIQSVTRNLGDTPKRIIDQRILLEAKRLLIHTNKSVKEISFELGFDESTNFVKYFKKHQKTTPKEYRQNFYFPLIS